MAVDRSLTRAVGDALISFVDWFVPRLSSRVDDWLRNVADVVRPEPPMSIRTLDGLLLTGLLVADRGQVLLFIGVRSPAISGPNTEAQQRRYDDGSIPLWARGVDPHDLEIDPYRRR